MDTITLKKYIYENKKIEFILDNINCKNIKYHSNLDIYTCCNFNGDNKTAVNVKNNEYINVINWTRSGFDEKSDIITLIQYNLNYSFLDAVKYLHRILGLKYTIYKRTKENKIDSNPLDIFTKHISSRSINVYELPILNENIFDEYVPLLYIEWYKEGIMPWTANKFGLCYSYKRKRIIIPIRHWLSKKLVGINARTTIKNYRELGISKYCITSTYQKSLNLYGLAENYDDIQQAGYVVVYESEKSVLKRDSLCDSTGVALQGHSISDEQVRILIGLNVDIIIAMDKDVSIEEIKFMCSKFSNTRRVYYIEDKYDLLKEKESPADKSNKIFNFLFKHKIRYRHIQTISRNVQ